MVLKDPTAWKDDVTFYMDEDAVVQEAEVLEPQRLTRELGGRNIGERGLSRVSPRLRRW